MRQEKNQDTSSACFRMTWSWLLRESLRQQASCLNGSSWGCQSMLKQCQKSTAVWGAKVRAVQGAPPRMWERAPFAGPPDSEVQQGKSFLVSSNRSRYKRNFLGFDLHLISPRVSKNIKEW